MEQHGDQIADILSKVAQIVLAVSRAFLELATSDKVKGFLDGLLNTFGKVDDATGKWVADTEKIKELLEALAVFVAGVFVKKITDAFKDVLKEAKPLLALLAPLLAGLGIGGSIGAGVAIGTAVGADAAVPNAQKPGVTNHWDDEASGAAGGAGIGGAIKRAWQWGKNAVGLGGGQSGTKPVGSWWTPQRQQQAIDKLKAGGLTELGAKGLVARWAAVEAPGGPASVNPTSGAFGIGQWLGSRKRPVAGNADFDAQLDHAVNELNTTEKAARDRLNSAKTDQEAATGASMFERAEGYDPRSGRDNFTDATAATMKRLGEAARQPITGSKEVVGGLHPLDGKGRLTSDINSARVNPVTGQTRPHKGIDLAAPAGTDVKAMTDGIVSLGSHGDITIKQANGASTTYRHVAPSVEDGARVAAGAIIAQLKANDPRSTGPHLHLEARDRDGNLTDPKGLLAPRAQSEAAQAAPAPPKPSGPSLAEQAKGAVDSMNDVMGRLDTTKLRAFGEATQGFDPGKFFVVPPAGTESTTNNSSVRNQTFHGGTTNITQHVAGGADEGAAVFKRHKERQTADDVRYAASVFA